MAPNVASTTVTPTVERMDMGYLNVIRVLEEASISDVSLMSNAGFSPEYERVNWLQPAEYDTMAESASSEESEVEEEDSEVEEDALGAPARSTPKDVEYELDDAISKIWSDAPTPTSSEENERESVLCMDKRWQWNGDKAFKDLYKVAQNLSDVTEKDLEQVAEEKYLKQVKINDNKAAPVTQTKPRPISPRPFQTVQPKVRPSQPNVLPTHPPPVYLTTVRTQQFVQPHPSLAPSYQSYPTEPLYGQPPQHIIGYQPVVVSQEVQSLPVNQPLLSQPSYYQPVQQQYQVIPSQPAPVYHQINPSYHAPVQPVYQPVASTVYQPHVQPVYQLPNQPIYQPVPQTVYQPPTQTSYQAAAQNIDQPVPQMGYQPATQTVYQPSTQTIYQPAPQTVYQPTVVYQPPSQPVYQPAYQPPVQTTYLQPAQPVYQTSYQPSSQPIYQPPARPVYGQPPPIITQASHPGFQNELYEYY
ncbi:unnamed protein product [Bursaphelenchus okinawaensis]|uniref:Uncharacterized protein n=1 Tax=Bursaphelenchus okinawaensis TaxID=465554 RepID=A0A811LQF0_9BILA|nr:unnamed protein product [Bursaphelenchus okinawaensis]CAG9127873.1 unnamed protein product [Bursaphelenchus okinawaensis]